jgi:CubicO group peptidase (beta-lactamase class C family)
LPSDVKITIKMLMTHTSSIIDNWDVIKYYKGDPKVSLKEYLIDILTIDGNL